MYYMNRKIYLVLADKRQFWGVNFEPHLYIWIWNFILSLHQIYEHFHSENIFKNPRCIRITWSLIKLARILEVHNLVEKTKNIHVIDIVTFPKQLI